MLGHIGRQSIVVLEAPLVTGDYNAQVRDWDRATRTTVARCTVDYTSASETRQANDQTVTRAQAFLPPGAPRVSEGARVEWDGRTWEVDGRPTHAEAAGPLSGQVVSLLEVAG